MGRLVGRWLSRGCGEGLCHYDIDIALCVHICADRNCNYDIDCLPAFHLKTNLAKANNLPIIGIAGAILSFQAESVDI